jgi:phospholipase C
MMDVRRFACTVASGALLLTAAPVAPAPAQPARAAFSLANLRARVKHVFVIYQENRSFDSYFGSYPGADNLATPEAHAHGFRQYDPLGNQWVTPYRIADPDLADADHARPALITKSDGGRMDLFVSTEEFGALARGRSRKDAQRIGLLTMGFEDCDTVPFLWKYAHGFALYDHFFQGMYGPSTPGNIDLIAAQTGQTQWARHAAEEDAPNDRGPGEPVVDDEDPAFGPYAGGAPGVTQYDQTYANVFLTLSGVQSKQAKKDDGDIRKDVAALERRDHAAIPWGWYQEGFKSNAPRSPYIAHHNALQYFGYLRQNPYFWRGVHDLRELLPAIEQGTLGDRSVVFVKGGYENPFHWRPANPAASVQKHFLGDDDHPGYSDSQLSESLVATVVNAVARSKYWNDSAIFVIWDDSEGYYDHVPPPQFERCPDGHPCGDGPRVPAILISPYAKSGGVVADVSDHASFVKFLGALFDLPPLATLPDEAPYMPLGPRDTNPMLSDLTGGFDPARLAGTKAPIPASAAEIPDGIVDTFPARMSCATLGIVPASVPGSQRPPAGFAPRLSER